MRRSGTGSSSFRRRSTRARSDGAFAAPRAERAKGHPMSVLAIGEEAACAVYRCLGGEETPLTAILERTRQDVGRGERVTWRVPVSPRTVHRLEGLYRLSRDERAELEL